MKRYIKSSDVVDDYEVYENTDDWSPYQGKKYDVICGNNFFLTNDPYVAIQKWFQGQKKNPMDCAIMARYKSDAIDLASIVTMDLLEEMNEKYPQGYKLDWLFDCAQRFVRSNGSGFLGDGDLGDQVPPFTYG